jgi:hypothetical protein
MQVTNFQDEMGLQNYSVQDIKVDEQVCKAVEEQNFARVCFLLTNYPKVQILKKGQVTEVHTLYEFVIPAVVISKDKKMIHNLLHYYRRDQEVQYDLLELAILYSIEHGYDELCNYLISICPTNIVTDPGSAEARYLSAHRAVKYNRIDMLKIFWKSEDANEYVYRRQMIFYAVKYENFEALRFLIEKSFEEEFLGPWAVFCIAKHKNIKMLESLLEIDPTYAQKCMSEIIKEEENSASEKEFLLEYLGQESTEMQESREMDISNEGQPRVFLEDAVKELFPEFGSLSIETQLGFKRI